MSKILKYSSPDVDLAQTLLSDVTFTFVKVVVYKSMRSWFDDFHEMNFLGFTRQQP